MIRHPDPPLPHGPSATRAPSDDSAAPAGASGGADGANDAGADQPRDAAGDTGPGGPETHKWHNLSADLLHLNEA